MQQKFDVHTDHFQFYVGDRKHGPYLDTTDLWSAGSSVVTLPQSPFLVGIATARYGGITRVSIDVTTSELNMREGDWEEMGSFVLKVPSGSLVLWAPEASDLTCAPSMSVQPGEYHGLVFSRGTDAVTDEMMLSGSDEYCVVLSHRANLID